MIELLQKLIKEELGKLSSQQDLSRRVERWRKDGSYDLKIDFPTQYEDNAKKIQEYFELLGQWEYAEKCIVQIEAIKTLRGLLL